MITHFVGPAEVEGYALDLANRLVKLGSDFPQNWYLLGKSGEVFADAVIDKLPAEKISSLKLVRISANRETGRIRFLDSIVKTRAPSLLLDSAVHSGNSMLRAANALTIKGISDLITYTLVLKRGSVIIPNFFGILVEETDRCIFQLPEIPNNRLCETRPFGVLRTLTPDDTKRRFFKTGESAIEETTFGSLLYEKERGSNVFVYERKNEICGVLSFTEQSRSLFIDLVATSRKYHGKGIGGALMRWAETWARSRRFEAVDLWAIQKRVSFYEKRKFKLIDRTINLDGVKFSLMRRPLLYNTSLVDPFDRQQTMSLS